MTGGSGNIGRYNKGKDYDFEDDVEGVDPWDFFP
jgi:hypothetical protein